MGFRQPDVCFCFGGRCWRKFCPEKSKNKKSLLDTPHERPKGKKRSHPPILTLSQTLKERAKDKKDDE